MVADNPKQIVEHTCPEFYGISVRERRLREESIQTYGLAMIAQSMVTKPGGSNLAYTKEELGDMTRSMLRPIAEGLGLSPAKATDMAINELRVHILENQGAKGSKAGKPKKQAPREAEKEEEEEPVEKVARSETAPSPPRRELEEPETEGRVTVDVRVLSEILERQKKMEELLMGIGLALDNHETLIAKTRGRLSKFSAVLDRKLNCLIGQAVVRDGEKLDPLKHEESFSKEAKHTVSFGLIQKLVGEPKETERVVEDGEES